MSINTELAHWSVVLLRVECLTSGKALKKILGPLTPRDSFSCLSNERAFMKIIKWSLNEGTSIRCPTMAFGKDEEEKGCVLLYGDPGQESEVYCWDY